LERRPGLALRRSEQFQQPRLSLAFPKTRRINRINCGSIGFAGRESVDKAPGSNNLAFRLGTGAMGALAPTVGQ